MAATTRIPDLLPSRSLLDLTGKTAIVTGAAVGIGLGIARRLHEANASVVLADLDLHACELACRDLNAARPASALAAYGDVSDPEDVAAIMGDAAERFDGIDILVNNAGIYPFKPLAELDLATFRHVIDVNLTGLFICTKAVSERMIAQGRGGRIVNVTSIDALHPSMPGLSHYDASKHGAWGFTKSSALELAPHRIWVNAIAPGGILTPGTRDALEQETRRQFERMIPMGRMGDPDEVGRVALFLASDLSSYLTGTQIVVDGGRLLS